MKSLALFMLLLSINTSFGQTADELFDLGMTFHQSNPSKAIQYYTKTISEAPYYASAYFNRGLLYFQDEAYEKAKLDFETTVKISPKDAEAFENLASTLFQIKQYKKAKDNYDKAIQLNPYSSDLFLNRAICKSILQDKSAVQDFIKALEINARNTDALRCYGDYLLDKKDNKQAMSYYNQAIQLNPNDAEAYNSRGKLNWSLGLMSKAIQDFTKAINLEDNYQFLVNRGLLFQENNQMDEAFSDLIAAIQLQPNDLSAYNGLGFLFLDKKDYSKALQYFDFGINRTDNSVDAIKGHLEACIGSNLYKKAILDCKNILRILPNDNFAKEKLRFCESKI